MLVVVSGVWVDLAHVEGDVKWIGLSVCVSICCVSVLLATIGMCLVVCQSGSMSNGSVQMVLF